jgi:hypothetical protein
MTIKRISSFFVSTFVNCLLAGFLLIFSNQVQSTEVNIRDCIRLGLIEGSNDFNSCINLSKEKGKKLSNQNEKSRVLDIVTESNLIGLWSNDCILKKQNFSFYKENNSVFLVTKDAGITQYEGLVTYAELYTKKVVKLRVKITSSNVSTVDVGSINHVTYELPDQMSLLLIESFRDNIYLVKNAIIIKTGQKIPPWKRCI